MAAISNASKNKNKKTKMKIFLIIVTIFVAIDVLIVFYVIWRRSRKKIPEKELEHVQRTWKKIIRLTDKKHAILDADKLLDHALYLHRYRGSLGGKLKKAAPLFKSINKVWAAHKIRNNIAHQINYDVDEKTYRNAMMAFKQAFQDLKMFK